MATITTYSGWLGKLDKSLGGVRRDVHRYYFELIGHELFYWKNESKSSENLVDVISLANCSHIHTISSKENTANFGPGFVLDMLGDVARQVSLFVEDESTYDDWIKAVENAQQSHFYMNNLTHVPGDALKKGWLNVLDDHSPDATKVSEHPQKWSKGFIRLFPDRLDVFDREGSTTRKIATIRLNPEFYVGDSRVDGGAFIVSDFDETYRFYCEEADEKTHWMQLIARVIRNLGTINKFQERIVESTLFKEEPGSLRDVSEDVTPLKKLVRQASMREGVGAWASIREEKQRKMEQSDAAIRQSLERQRNEEVLQHEQEQEQQRHIVVVAREKLARATKAREEAVILATVSKENAIELATAEIMAKIKELEDGMQQRVFKEVNEELSIRWKKEKENKINASMEAKKAQEVKESKPIVKKKSAEKTSKVQKVSKKPKPESRKSVVHTPGIASRLSKAISSTGFTPNKIANAYSAAMDGGKRKISGASTKSNSNDSKVPIKSAAKPPVEKKVEPPPVAKKEAEPVEKKESPPPRKQSAAKVKLQKTSGLLAKVKMWDNKIEQVQTFQVADVVQKSEIALRPGDAGYGTAPEGSKTAMRAKKAQDWVEKEIKKLLEVIEEIGEKDSNGKTCITFGKLFVAYQDISDTLVGILKSAKKRKLVSYEGVMLFQGLHNHVVITIN